MTIAFIVIGFAICMAVGPLMMMRPNKRDIRLERMRTLALKNNLTVRIAPKFVAIPSCVEHGQLVVYSRPWPDKQMITRHRVKDWILFRHKYEHDLHFYKVWHYLGESRVPDSWVNVIQKRLDQLPEEILGLGVNTRYLECYWEENSEQLFGRGASEVISDWLDQTIYELTLT